MITGIIIMCVACLIFIFGAIIYSQKKAHRDHPPFHREVNGIYYVSVFFTSKTGGSYKEYSFEKKDGSYVLTKECKEELEKGLKSIPLLCVVFILAGLVAGVAVEGAPFHIVMLAVVLFSVSFIGICGLFEYTHYKKCIDYLKDIRMW